MEYGYLDTFPILYDINVLEALQDKFGGLSAWSETLSPESGEPPFSAVIDTVEILIAEGIDAKRDEGEDITMPSRKQIGRLITRVGLAKTLEIIKNSAIAAAGEGDQKNA